MSGILLIVSGPAGSGKNTVCERLMAETPKLIRAITSTTRAPRDGEEHGKDYYFLSEQDFKNKIANGEFYEWAQVHGRYYGTLKDEIISKLESGKDVILIIDVQGAKAWRELALIDERIAKSLHSVFIRPASLDTIRERMALRGDSEEEILKRIETAKKEFLEERYFDISLFSDTKDADFEALKKIYRNFKFQTC